MGKKIVVLNGSPRMGGNTAALIDAFTKGAESAGHTVTSFYLEGMDIHPCIGCCRGGGDIASPCTQKDEMDKVYAAYVEADVVCLASPLYWYTVSGQLKCAVDRLFAVTECDPGYETPFKECTLLMAAEGNGFEESIYWYESLMKRIGWKNRGTVLCPGVMDVGDIAGNPRLADAEALGASL